MVKILLFLTILIAGMCRPIRALPSWAQDLNSALKAAQAKQSLVVIDFYAPWCYSCYYMDQNVLNQPELSKFQGQAEFVKMDVDSPAGAELKAKREVHFLPSYVILDSKGREVGRIVGEQVRGDFISQLSDIISRHSTIDELRAGLAKAKPAQASSAVKKILPIYVQRHNFKDGLEFWSKQPAKIKNLEKTDKEVLKDLLRLRLGLSAEKKDAAECAKTGRALLSMDLGCELPYDSMTINACVETLGADQKKALYDAEEAPLQALLSSRVFVAAAGRCADIRSPIELGQDLYSNTGRKDEVARLLDRAIKMIDADLGGDLKKDRNRADNLRVFYELAERHDELQALFPKLIAAYPEEYIYYHRFGKFLLSRGNAKDALAQFDLALPKSYGANRLAVIGERAKALSQLGRKKDALDDLAKAIQDNPASFPDAVASLNRLKSDLEKAPH